MHSVTLDSSKIRKTILNLVVSLYLLAFALYYINPAEIRKVYYLAGYLTVLSALLSIRTTKTWTQNWDLAGALALFALGLFAWYGLNYAHGEYWDIYDSYKDTAKVLAVSAIVVFLLSSLRFTFNATWFNYLLIAAGLVTNLYAIYQGLTLHVFRIQITLERATIIAYIFTMTNIVLLGTILELKNKYRYVLFLVCAMTGLAAIAFTETRAALLACPVLIILLLFVHPQVSKQQLLKLCAAFVIALVLLTALFHQKLIARYQEMQTDITQYQDHNSVSSVGSRLVMFKTGLQAGLDAPFGESAERRGNDIKQQVQANPGLAGALDYINVHMHNEFIENFSLRGIGGVATLILLYAVLLLNAWRKRNAIQGVLTLTVIVYGLSDVIFFSKEAVIVFSMALILSVLQQKIAIGQDKAHA